MTLATSSAELHPVTLSSEWDAALGRLEADLSTVEAALEAGEITELQLPDWTEPRGLTRIPQHLVTRAVALLTRQDLLLARLHEAASGVRHELSYVASVDDEQHQTPSPVFLDRAL